MATGSLLITSLFKFFFLKQSSPSSPEPASLPAEDLSTNSNGPKPAEIMLDDDREDLFAGNYSLLLMCLHKLFCSWAERNVLFWEGALKPFR